MKRDKIQNTVIIKDNDINNECCLDNYDYIKINGNNKGNDDYYKNDYDKMNIIIVIIIVIVIVIVKKIKLIKVIKIV